MIDKILNRYYFDRFKKEVSGFFTMYFIDYKVEKKTNSIVCIKVKNRKYKESEYVTLLSFEYERCLFFITNFDKVEKELKERLKEYDKNN